MQQITNDRYVWAAIILNLNDEYAPDIPPYVDINNIGVFELKRHVFRALRAHGNWSITAAPKVSHETLITLHNPNNELGWFNHPCYGRPVTERFVYIVPGGEYLMVGWPIGALQCYRIGTSECIWNLWPLNSGSTTPGSELITESFCPDRCVSQDANELRVLVVGRRLNQETGIIERYV